MRAEHDVNRTLPAAVPDALQPDVRVKRSSRRSRIRPPSTPTNDLVTIARQGNARHNEVISHQFSLIERFATGRIRHAIERWRRPQPRGVSSRPGSPASARGHRSNIYHPEPARSRPRLRACPVAGIEPGETTTIGLSSRSTPSIWASRWQATAGARIEHYDTSFLNVDATGRHDGQPRRLGRARAAARPAWCSAPPQTGNVYVVVRDDRDPSGHRELHAERAGQQPEQPQREAAGVRQLRGRLQVGLVRHPGVADRRGVPHA